MPGSVSAAALRAALVAEMPRRATVEPHLDAAIRQAAALPGQLLRGCMVAAGAVCHGASPAAARRLGVAVEFFHLASLLLDDLPCMDNAVIRRGRPCLHHQFGEATTLLAALAFINRAYALVHQALADQPVAIRRAAESCLESALGSAGLVGGQARDLRFSARTDDARTVGRIAAEKTGALFRLAIVLPAVLAQPEAEERRQLHALSLYLGLAYQAADDLGDVFANETDTGKTTGRDRELGRPNLALVLGTAAAQRRLQRYDRLAGQALERLHAINIRWNYLQPFLAATRSALSTRSAPRTLITAA